MISTITHSEIHAAQRGKASWYSVRTNGGTHTASGQRLQNHAATAAHKSLPLGTRVRVTNLVNGRSQVVTITDRGPYIAGRIIDVTIGTAKRLGFVNRGVVPVKVETVRRNSGKRSLFKRKRNRDRDRVQDRRRLFRNRGEREDRGPLKYRRRKGSI